MKRVHLREKLVGQEKREEARGAAALSLLGAGPEYEHDDVCNNGPGDQSIVPDKKVCEASKIHSEMQFDTLCHSKPQLQTS